MNIKSVTKIGVLALAFCSLQAMAQTGPKIVVGSGSGQVGSATPVVISVDYDADGTVAAFQVDVTYDAANLTPDLSSCGGILGGANFTCTDIGPGAIRFLGDDAKLDPIPSGSLGSISFDISAAPIGDYDLLIPSADEIYSNNVGDGVNSTGSVAGLIQVNAGPQPVWGDEFTPVVITGQVGSGSIITGFSVNNDAGEDGSVLNYTCTKTADPANKLTLGGQITDIDVPKGSVAQPTVSCDKTVVGDFIGEVQCTHNGTNTSPVVVPVSCSISAGPQAMFSGTPTGLAMVAVEQDDADPTGSVAITNSGDATTTLTGTCILMGPSTEITMSNGAFSVAEGAAAHVVGLSCDAAAEGSYTNTLSCTHDGANATPVDYAVSCAVGPPGDAVYESNPLVNSVIEMTPDGDVPVGADVPDQVLTITNDAAEANDRDLGLLGCALTTGTAITATAPTTPLPAQASTMVTFSCSTEVVGTFTDTYSCPYDVDGDGEPDGTATYTINCGVRAAASEIQESPLSGTALSILVPINGTGGTSVSFAEILDEGVDAEVNSCSFGTSVFSVVTALPGKVLAGDSLTVNVSATDPGTGKISFTDILTCIYTDSDSDNTDTVSWPITLTVLAQPIPTLSEWGLLLMILSLMGMGGMVIRRKVRS